MMRSLSSRVSKRILSSAMPCYGNASSFFMVSRQPYRSSTLRQIVYKSQRNAIPCDFLKWGSLGSIRTSKFASGFSPLKPKPLDSIIDMERAKNKSAEELADVWDDYHLGRGHIAASMKAKLYKLFEQRSATDILLFRCGGEVVTQPCLCKCRRHTYLSQALKITRPEELKLLHTSQFLTTPNLLKARIWFLFEGTLSLLASSPTRRQNGFWTLHNLFT
ncbi:uncharacterized protein LOC107820942 isoform X3 [Nicotiana tabacum]|uniref:Uncharacterized protein LOC107820942 isoform X3 n=1 Tax=Nicotiana tabacum TaxID=4097 RepID=A0AC58SZC7_TOBAC